MKFNIGDEVKVVNMPVAQQWYDDRGAGIIVESYTGLNEGDELRVKFVDINIPFLIHPRHLEFCDTSYEQDFKERIRDRLS